MSEMNDVIDVMSVADALRRLADDLEAHKSEVRITGFVHDAFELIGRFNVTLRWERRVPLSHKRKGPGCWF